MAKRKTTSKLSQFFKEDAKNVFSGKKIGEEQLIVDKKAISVYPDVQLADPEKLAEEWKKIRRFFLTSKGGNVPDGYKPVHLIPKRVAKRNLQNYPVWMTGYEEPSFHKKCHSLESMLLSAITEQYPQSSQGKVVKDVHQVITNCLSELIPEEGMGDFISIFDQALLNTKKKLDLRGAEKDAFDEQIAKLKTRLPENGSIVELNPDSIIFIFQAAILDLAHKRTNDLQKKIDEILPPLIDLLLVEKENGPDAINPAHLKSSMSFADHYFNFEKLSSVIPESSSEHISSERFQRIKKVIETLKASKSQGLVHAHLIVQQDVLDKEKVERILASCDIQHVPRGKACAKSSFCFQENIQAFTEIIKNLRIGKLEVADEYNSVYHDQLFDSFDWGFFTEEEMSLAPTTLLIAESESLLKEELKDFSLILGSKMPIKMIALRSNYAYSQIDPTSLAIAYRNSYVMQSTCLDPESLFQKLEEGLTNFTPALFHIINIDEKEDAWLNLSASVDAREFPLFTYTGSVGTAWGSRFNIDENSEVNKLWPSYSLEYQKKEEKVISSEVDFTFADFQVLNTDYSHEYFLILPEYWTDDLVTVSEYLQLAVENRYGKIPFIWMESVKNELGKVAVSWDCIQKTIEIQDFWEYLQDSSGVHNYHTERALKLQEEKIRKEFENEVTKLREEHNKDLEKTRLESTEDAMDHLTSALLDLDADLLVPASPAPTKVTKDIELTKEPVDQDDLETKEEEKSTNDELVIAEPWIETPLCTNCNECTDINNRMFKYNDEKLAFIADPRAGTYAQLVEAAEICPVHIIHPGEPLDPNEPGLDDLKKRAKKYN